MRNLRTFFVTAALISTVVLSTSHSAKSGEKRCKAISTCIQPASNTCVTSASQPGASTQTCCQPTAASVQPKIELVAYTRPASPRRLAPQPDALEINPTTAQTICAQYLIYDFGSIKSYYAIKCSNNTPTIIYANGLAPLPGDCANPNGACVTVGASVVQTAFASDSSSLQGGLFHKAIHLKQKLKAGAEPANKANPLATGPHQLKERTRVGQPIYVSFAGASGDSERLVVELQRYSVKGTGKTGQELSGTFATGVEIDVAPAGTNVKQIDQQRVRVVTDNVAQIEISGVTYDIVTATKLAQSR